MRLFGYPYNNDLVICKDRPDYLEWILNFFFFAACGYVVDKIRRRCKKKGDDDEKEPIPVGQRQCVLSTDKNHSAGDEGKSP